MRRHPAVDRNHLSGDVAGLLGSQKNNEFCDVFWLSDIGRQGGTTQPVESGDKKLLAVSAALLCRTSIRPNSATVAATTDLATSSSARSPPRAIAWAPVRRSSSATSPAFASSISTTATAAPSRANSS